MLTIATWRWGNKYDPQYVSKLASALKRNLRQPYRFVCVTDTNSCAWTGVENWPIADDDKYLLGVKGCFVRLRMFDPEWQCIHGVDDRLVCIDLDVVITGQIDELFDRPEKFVILQGANSVNPCPFNGSLWMLRPGAYPEVWSEFSIEAARDVPFHEFPDDQGWFWHMLPNAAAWMAGKTSGVWSFRKCGWPMNDQLPSGARMVCFPGHRDPASFQRLTWVRQHWRSGGH